MRLLFVYVANECTLTKRTQYSNATVAKSRIDVYCNILVRASFEFSAEQRIFPDVQDGRQTKRLTEAKPEKYLRHKNPP